MLNWEVFIITVSIKEQPHKYNQRKSQGNQEIARFSEPKMSRYCFGPFSKSFWSYELCFGYVGEWGDLHTMVANFELVTDAECKF